jgi:hypothetical protein
MALIDMEVPAMVWPRIDVAPSSFSAEKIDNEEENLAKLRRLREDPNSACCMMLTAPTPRKCWNTEKQLLNLAKHRRDRELPNSVASRMDRVFPALTCPKPLRADPTHPNARRLRDDPSDM